MSAPAALPSLESLREAWLAAWPEASTRKEAAAGMAS